MLYAKQFSKSLPFAALGYLPYGAHVNEHVWSWEGNSVQYWCIIVVLCPICHSFAAKDLKGIIQHVGTIHDHESGCCFLFVAMLIIIHIPISIPTGNIYIQSIVLYTLDTHQMYVCMKYYIIEEF